MKLKVLVTFGTRPEAIKLAPLIRILKSFDQQLITKVCITAQHREMLDQVLDIFEITPDFDLNIMKPGQDLYDITANVLQGMKSVLNDFEPDIVIVHGDTTTTFAASLAAFYKKIRVAHIEAGLRTGNIYSPWPEEMNRVLVSRIASFNFAPTEESANNLISEKVDKGTIFVTGNTVIDALFWVVDLIERNQGIRDKLIEEINETIADQNFNVLDSRFILVTAHRRENFGDNFLNICNALKDIALKNTEIHIIYPVHLNPSVQEPVNKILSGIPNVHLIKPMSYLPFVYMMNKSHIIITDSGGIQEEAPSLGKPVLVIRNTTERQEAVDAGVVRLVGTDRNNIVSSTQELIDSNEAYSQMASIQNPYGDGKACEKIVEQLINQTKIRYIQ